MSIIPQAMQYYSSLAGGRRAFAIGTGYLAIPNTGGDSLCALVNPDNSGADIYLDLGEFGADKNTRFHRFGAPATSLTGLANPIVGNNLSRGSTPSVARMYTRGNYTVATPGAETKVAFMQAYQTYFAYLGGRSILRPGRAIYWTIDNATAINVNVYFEYWELPAQPQTKTV